MEQLTGGWICEISEMLAMSKARETEDYSGNCLTDDDEPLPI
ncbi:MAG: hypothetical protein Q4F31_08810 [Eubacteriales bacterium]|nr:hypothetical protein [Eubacteriales bacterium]